MVSPMLAGAGVALGQTRSAGSAQDFPNKPIRIVTSAPGGGSDFASRIVAQALTESFGQPVVVDNRGNSAGAIVSKALPDGYTILLDGASHWIGPLLQDAGYDAVKDFSPITVVTTAPNIVVVHPSVAVNSIRELVALAKAGPGKLNYGTGGSGGAPHLAVELFKSMAGVNITRVNYKGSGPAITALMGGEVQLMITSAGSVAAAMKSGKLKALAITAAQPSVLLPGLPTVTATGVPGYEVSGYTGMFAPAKTRPSIVNRVNQEMARILNRADVRDRFLAAGVEAASTSPERLAATMKDEISKWRKVIQDAHIRDE